MYKRNVILFDGDKEKLEDAGCTVEITHVSKTNYGLSVANVTMPDDLATTLKALYGKK